MKLKKAGRKIYIFLLIAFIIAAGLPAFKINASASYDMSDISRIIQSETFVLIDGETGQVLLERNMRVRMYPASTTKIMTAMLALENGRLSDVITMSYDAVWSIINTYGRNTSNIALDVDEQITLEDALYAIAIESANDASNGVAELIGGSLENFARKMTARAKELGAVNTNFSNAHGLPDENHYTTAYDMALIMSAAIKTPEFSKIFTSVKYNTPPTNKQPKGHEFNRKNSLNQGYYSYSGLVAEKTGYTSDAGYTYVAAATRNGRTLIAVVMRSPGEVARWEDTTMLFDYGFNEFKQITYKADEFEKEDYSVEFSNGSNANMSFIPNPGEEVSFLVLNSLSKQDIEITYNFTANEEGGLYGRALFSLKSGASSGMFAEVGETALRVYINGYEILDHSGGSSKTGGSLPDSKKGNPVLSALHGIYSVLSVILQIIGVIAVIFTIIFVRHYMRVQKIKKQRKQQYRRQINRNNNGHFRR